VLGIIDAGNTCIKAGIFSGNELLKNADFKAFGNELGQFFVTHNVKTVYLGSVIRNQFTDARLTIVPYSTTHQLPITNKYLSPETLGVDRIANAAAAYVLNRNKGPVLSIDMGTCIKFDVVDNEGNYLGGSISPGLSMRLKALHVFTQKLPEVEITHPAPLIGRNTQSSIASGVFNGIAAEISGMAEQYEADFKGIKAFLTGGDAAYFTGKLKNNIFASPFLTMHGLNAIARLNGL